MRTLSIAREFSRTPGPRFKTEGSHSGEEFRERLLKPAWQEARTAGERLLIDLDGTEGYATSFLEESFGGLARECGCEAVQSALEFKSEEEPFLIEEVRGYIERTRGAKK